MLKSKEERLQLAELAIKQLEECQKTRQNYDDLLQATIASMGDTDLGPLIAGIYSAKFPEHIKDELRTLAGNIGKQSEHSLMMWQQSGRRLHTWLRLAPKYRKLKDGRVSYY